MFPVKRFSVVLGAALISATSLTGLASASSGNGNVTNETFQINETMTNECNGALVALDGTVHEVMNQTDNGGLLLNATGHLTGTDETGNPYVANFSAHGTLSGSSQSLTEHEVLVSQGSAPNQMITITFSESGVTVNSVCTGSAG